ncbi:MAG: HD domain-containing protein [Rhodospirillales bacterium]|jgi:[1-hydroxy-2-(trimethylamino)ethyl]phosphonate dioxygenase|nr:HD domain-containing protein [Rhodospirillales bacterium]MBT4039478.1 HD domain-containing protein [Rhodospirillales bacterium]MBT4627115.1 HD domain-containing protein [Rhodospirillales bacterium]MBT5351145.1 HD domain-containing protein [Rhodospirillales bacterium]MBT5520460.1 HD domain-containing protein [Rhodospirillales bacterium]
MAEQLTSDTIVDVIADIFERRGADSYLGEDVTMSEHMLQAAQCAEQAGASEDMVAAALLHDIGHYTGEFPVDTLEKGMNNYHDETGAAILQKFFPALVVDCVRYHVAAKRYLCATRDDYFGRLSDASVHSLNLQGGPMDDDEVAEFEKNSNLDSIVNIRLWDDEGKVAGIETPSFADYTPLLRRVIQSHSDATAA